MNEEFAVLLFFFGISVTVNLALAVGAFRAARRARRLENRLLADEPAEDPRIESLEARLEQLARGQEFLSKLVSEKRRALSAREREVTPH